MVDAVMARVPLAKKLLKKKKRSLSSTDYRDLSRLLMAALYTLSPQGRAAGVSHSLLAHAKGLLKNKGLGFVLTRGLKKHGKKSGQKTEKWHG